MIKYLLLWFPMLLIAILNGAARDLWYSKYLEVETGKQLSTITLIVFFSFYFFFVFKVFPPQTTFKVLSVGLLWMLLTLIFEFGFGLYRGHSWQFLLSEYNILRGKLWILVPLWVGIGPYVIFRLMRS